MSEIPEKPMRRKMAAVVTAVGIVSLMAGSAWATAGTAEDGAVVRDYPGTGQIEQNAPADDGAPPIARPHPRGLPREAERGRG